VPPSLAHPHLGSGDREGAGGEDPDRAPHATHRLSRRDRQLRAAGCEARSRRDQRVRWILGKQIDLLSEDSINPATAATKAQRMLEQDARWCCSARSPRPPRSLSCRSPSATRRFLLDRRALGRAARQELQQILLPLRHPEHRDGERGRHCAVAEGMVKGKKFFTLTADYIFAMTCSRPPRPSSARMMPI